MKAREASPPLPVAATAPPSYDGGMIRLIDDETGALIGTVTEAEDDTIVWLDRGRRVETDWRGYEHNA